MLGYNEMKMISVPAIPAFQQTSLVLGLAGYLLNQNPIGYGEGVIAIPYRDCEYLQGDYLLFIQIEKVN